MHQKAHQRRFARSRRADYRQRVAPLELGVKAAYNHLAVVAKAQVFELKLINLFDFF
jgi:hypothetical protein